MNFIIGFGDEVPGFLPYLTIFAVFVVAIAVAIFIGTSVRKAMNKKNEAKSPVLDDAQDGQK